MRHGGAGFRCADFLFGIIAAHEQAHPAVRAFQLRLPFAARGGDGLGVMHVNPVFQAMPRQRAIHRAGVHINVAQCLGHKLRVRALAARARAINCYDNRMFFQML